MYLSSIADLTDPFAPKPLAGEEPAPDLSEIPDPPPEED